MTPPCGCVSEAQLDAEAASGRSVASLLTSRDPRTTLRALSVQDAAGSLDVPLEKRGHGWTVRGRGRRRNGKRGFRLHRHTPLRDVALNAFVSDGTDVFRH